MDQRSLAWRLLLMLVLVRQCVLQRSDTCAVPCQLGFSCYTDGVGEPSCIPMSMYLNIVQGQGHRHSGRETRQLTGELPVIRQPMREARVIQQPIGESRRPGTFDREVGRSRFNTPWVSPTRVPSSPIEGQPSRFRERPPNTRRFPSDPFTDTFRDRPVPRVTSRQFGGHVNRNRFSGEINPRQFVSDTNPRQFSEEINSRRFEGGMNTRPFPADMNSMPFPRDMNTRQFPGNMNNRPFPADMNNRPFPADMNNRPFPADMNSMLFPGNMNTRQFPDDMNTRQFPGDMNSMPFPRDMSTRQFPGNINTRQLRGDMNTRQFSGELNSRQLPAEINSRQMPIEMNSRQLPNEMNTIINRSMLRESSSVHTGPDASRRMSEGSTETIMRNPPVSRVLIDPNTGQRFALVPLDQDTNTNTLPSRRPDQPVDTKRTVEPGSWSNIQRPASSPNKDQSKGHTPGRGVAPVPSVQAQNPFETQRSDNTVDSLEQLASATSIFKQDLSPVGPLTNNRTKSVSEIIEEFSRPSNQRHSVDTNVMDLEPVRVTEMPRISTTTNVQTVGRISSILRDDRGYYFMFYPKPDGDGMRVGITKNGFCPRNPPSRHSEKCDIRCTSDKQCPGELKCCPNSCGLLCTPKRKSGAVGVDSITQ